MSGYVYIMTNKPNGTLYVGVTSNLSRRVWEHKEGNVKGFTKKYDLKKLVFFEELPTIEGAIEQEKRIKNWERRFKIKLVLDSNPDWNDLYEALSA